MKGRLTDVEGLDKSYQDVNNVHVHNKTLFISGTHSLKDVETDLSIPLRRVKHTKRYAQVEQILSLYPRVDTIVGHSLGSAIGGEITRENPRIKQARLYGSPTLSKHDKIEYFRHYGDPWSISNKLMSSPNENFRFGDPHSYRGFKTFYN